MRPDCSISDPAARGGGRSYGTGGRPPRVARGRNALTLVELLATATIVSLLLVLVAPVTTRLFATGYNARCVNSLRQLSAATQMYLGDNNQKFFPYYEDLPEGGRRWYFGTEPASSQGGPEGKRTVDVTDSPLHPYLLSVGKVEVCPAFPYGSDYWKPKFKGASYGYGYNVFLSPPLRPSPGAPMRPTPISLLSIPQPSKVILFGDCAQVNDFQAPASSGNPLLEEFYMIDDTYKTIHFRHTGRANMVFLDGHVEAFSPHPGTLDSRIAGQTLGRITPRRSTEHLK